MLNNLRYILFKNSLDTIEWFKNIKHKNKTTSIQFDIIDFYPSIKKELLLQSINLAWNYTDITKAELDIILACRKSLLVYKFCNLIIFPYIYFLILIKHNNLNKSRL